MKTDSNLRLTLVLLSLMLLQAHAYCLELVVRLNDSSRMTTSILLNGDGTSFIPPEQTSILEGILTFDLFEATRTEKVELRQFQFKASQPLNFALTHVSSDITLAIDGDTVLAPDAIERLLPAFDDPKVGGACGAVIPRHVRTMWERGRYIEYLFAFTLHKPIQDYYDRPLIASGCFSAHRTALLREHGGWNTRTVAEDMDLTWTMFESGYKVRYVPEAVSYPIEPHNFHFMSKQLSRWCAGFLQCTRVHWKELLHVPVLRSAVAVGLWDATVASLAFLVAVPLLSVFVSPLFLLVYLLDLPAVLVPVLFKAHQRGEVGRALRSMPGFFVLRFVNAYFMLKAMWSEWIVRERMVRFEKGH